MSLDSLYILYVIGLVVFGLALARLWFQAFSNLLWMLAIRPYLVALVTLVSGLTLSVLLDRLVARQGLVATRFVLLLIFTPILAQTLSNLAAQWRAKTPWGRTDPLAKDFIFKWARQQQLEAFVAGLTAPPAPSPPLAADDEAPVA